MESHHIAWLSAHPERSATWLADRIADGFHVHHMDGNHENNDPQNLVLIESGDHMMLHNGVSRLIWRPPVPKNGGRKKKVVPTIEEMRLQLQEAEERDARAANRARKQALKESGRLMYASARASAAYKKDLAHAATINSMP